MNAPFLFDDLADDPALEQATFDIMELVDTFFRASVTVEEYDTMQKNVKKILLEAFDEKKSTDSRPHSRPLLLRPETDDRD